MTILEEAIEAADGEGVLKMDDLDDAIIGYSAVWDSTGNRPVRLIYSHRLLLKNLVQQGLSAEDALEWIDFNIEGAYVGERTPIIMYEGE